MARSEYDNGYVGVRQTHNRYINAIRICVSIFCIKRLPTITAAITPTSLADNQQPKNQAVEINKFPIFLQRVYAIGNCVIWECTASCNKNATNRNPRVPQIHISKPVSKSTIRKSLLKKANSTATKHASRLPTSTPLSKRNCVSTLGLADLNYLHSL